eukprot:2059851-Amphidinium_carterae.1
MLALLGIVRCTEKVQVANTFHIRPTPGVLVAVAARPHRRIEGSSSRAAPATAGGDWNARKRPSRAR